MSLGIDTAFATGPGTHVAATCAALPAREAGAIGVCAASAAPTHTDVTTARIARAAHEVHTIAICAANTRGKRRVTDAPSSICHRVWSRSTYAAFAACSGTHIPTARVVLGAAVIIAVPVPATRTTIGNTHIATTVVACGAEEGVAITVGAMHPNLIRTRSV